MSENSTDGRHPRDPDVMLIAAIFFPIHFFLIDKTALGVAYWSALAFLFFFWYFLIGLIAIFPLFVLWVIGIANARKWTREFNARL